MLTRRRLLDASLMTAVSAALVSGRSAFAAAPEAPRTKDPATQPPLVPTSGPDYNPVVTPNGWTLPWRMNGDWKEFHLVAEPVVREIAPGIKAYLWGYNGQSQGPTIEAVEGDKLRIYVTIINNEGALAHEFMLASENENAEHGKLMEKLPTMEHDDPNGKTLEPGKSVEILWKFSKPGRFEFACLIPGHHQAGMHGLIVVK